MIAYIVYIYYIYYIYNDVCVCVVVCKYAHLSRLCHIIHTMSHHHTYYVTSSYTLCHIIIHTMSHHHTYYVTSSYILCHIIHTMSHHRTRIYHVKHKTCVCMRIYLRMTTCACAYAHTMSYYVTSSDILCHTMSHHQTY